VPEFAGFRVASWDTPLRVNPNRQPGRWNYADSGPTQYIALHPLGTWAEYLHWHELRAQEQLRHLRLGVWAIRALVDDLLSIDFENAPTLDLDPEALVSDEWGPCQAAAERLRADRGAPKALLVPSAALPGAKNLVILGPRVGVPYSFRPIDSLDTPVTLAAAGARPPDSLLSLVRFRGQPHTEFEAWRAGEHFQLVEPQDELLAEGLRTPD
jgi:RES domain-containing protein